MSWVAIGKVVAVHPKLVIRLKFGKKITFPKQPEYKLEDRVQIACTENGDCTLISNEHNPTTDALPEAIPVLNCDYSKLDFAEPYYPE